MIVNGKKELPLRTKNYTFENSGYQKIYILMNITESTSLNKMFWGIKNLKSIKSIFNLSFILLLYLI